MIQTRGITTVILPIFLKIYLFCIIFGLVLLGCETTYISNAKNCKKYPCLIFKEEFDELDHDIWQHEVTAGGGGNGEFQYYTNNRSNSFVKDSTLYLKPTLTKDTFGEHFLTHGTLDLWGQSGPHSTCTGNQYSGCLRKGTEDSIINPIQSAKIRTLNSFSFKYGKLEVRVKLPKGDWLWPAIWLLPKQFQYGNWPASGEIDLVEAHGNEKLYDDSGASVGIDTVFSTLHWGPFTRANNFNKTKSYKTLKQGLFADKFHTFSFIWNTTGISFYVDNSKTLDVPVHEGGFWKLGNFENRYPNITTHGEVLLRWHPLIRSFFLSLMWLLVAQTRIS